MSNFKWAEEAEKLWNERSVFWNSRSREMWETGSRKDIVPFFQNYVQKGATVCDLGCGDGYGSLKFSQAGFSVTGVDVSDDMISKAKELNKNTSANFYKGDIAHLPFLNQQFDAIVAINSLEWTESPLEVLTEMKRMVKENGMACVGILGPTATPRVNSYRRLYGEKVVCNTMMPWEFEQLALENGWKKEAELGVYKRETKQLPKESLSNQMKQALTFMTVFMLRNENKI